ncbi:MAG TPA: DUF1573 domain-containing protein [Phycisphaerales bacterium]|jgi:hypothetical protein|nr:DUF1573 domain-containing protein [Phycisphaerales bacterium]
MSTFVKRVRFLALLAAAILPASLGLAQDKPAPTAQPAPHPAPVPAPPPHATVTPVMAHAGGLPEALKIDNMKFDWGDIADTEPVEHQFHFTVVADQEITIAVAASCGCTVPTMEKTTYKPGEEGKVTARFDPHSRQGPQTKTLTFTITNPQGKYAQQITTLTANVKALVTFDPPKMFLSEVDHMAGQKAKLTITGRKEGFKVLSVTPNNEHVKATLGEEKTSEVNGEKLTSQVIELDVGKGAPIGTLQSQLDIKTNDERAHLQPYFLGADVVGDIKASPAQAILRVNDPATPFSTTIKLDSRSGTSFNILSLDSDARKEMHVVTNFEKSADGNSYTITISGVTPAEPGMVQSFLTVSTDARGGETLRIPFTAVIRKLSQGMPMAMPPRAPTSIGAPSAPVKNVLPAGKH